MCSDAGVLLSMLDGVKRWSTEGGVNVLVPLTGSCLAKTASNMPVLDELDKLKRGAEPINAKARLTIRFLDGKTKARSRPARTVDGDGPSGTFRVQTSEELFKTWEECEGLANDTETESVVEKKDIPRHLRGMVNCVLFQRSQGIEYVIATEDADLITFAERWGITTMSGKEVDTKSVQALERYRNEMKVYEGRGRNAARHSPPQGRALWTPPKR
jgi:PIN domain